MANFDNYLPCEQYAAAPDSDRYPGFKTWVDESGANYYFAVVTNKGRVVLRSEAYTTESARDNGIESVMKNRDLEERYKIIQEESDGQWYVILRAGNHQEIARSCPYDSEKAAEKSLKMCFSTYTERSVGIIENYMPCEYYQQPYPSEKYPGFMAWQGVDSGEYFFSLLSKKGKVLLRSEAYTTESARDNGIESVMKNRDIEERYKIIQDENDGQWYVILRAGNHQEIARSCGYDSEKAATKGMKMCFSTYEERSMGGHIEDYLPCESYAAAPNDDRYPGFKSWYDEATSSHYFAAVSDTGRVIMRSEAYTTESARDNGIQSVMKNRDLEERYKVIQDETDGKWYLVLRAGNNQEIARSCAYDSEAAARAGIAMAFSTYSDRAVHHAAVIEDYLPCEAYDNKENSKYEGFTQFQDEATGLYYFAAVDKEHNVWLKSEGYQSASGRDNGIESVIKNKDIEERWTQEHDDKGYYMSLKAGNRQEIARTCHFSSEGALLGWWMPFTAGALAFGLADSAKATTAPHFAFDDTEAVPATPVEPEPEYVAPPPVVREEVKAAPFVTNMDAAPAATGGGGGGWWKWLLPLLLLGLLFLLWRQCGGCNKNTDMGATIPKTTPPAVVADTIKKAETPAPTPPPVKAATCDCNNQTDPVFKVNADGVAKKLSRLGTNPEFGDSHDLSPSGFYDKLAARHKSNSGDRAFLDRMYKAMGYSGFADAKPEQFSAVTLPVGSTGNLGYSKAHKTGYYTLPDAERDRMAFRIKAANGCDLHFMKTCGNHFFFCTR